MGSTEQMELRVCQLEIRTTQAHWSYQVCTRLARSNSSLLLFIWMALLKRVSWILEQFMRAQCAVVLSLFGLMWLKMTFGGPATSKGSKLQVKMATRKSLQLPRVWQWQTQGLVVCICQLHTTTAWWTLYFTEYLRLITIDNTMKLMCPATWLTHCLVWPSCTEGTGSRCFLKITFLNGKESALLVLAMEAKTLILF